VLPATELGQPHGFPIHVSESFTFQTAKIYKQKSRFAPGTLKT
jgi:hypothetical protein